MMWLSRGRYGEEESEVVELVVGFGFCIGIVLSYMPQHLACYKQRSAAGLSLWTLLLSTLSLTTESYAILLQDWKKFGSAIHSGYLLLTINVFMPTIQNLLSVTTGIPTYAIYYFSFSTAQEGPAHRHEVLLTAATWLLVGFGGCFTAWTLLIVPSASPSGINFFGVVATLTNAVQWIPQIDTTWKAQHEGVLSLEALFIAVIGDGLLALYWVLLTSEPIYVSATFAADAAMQCILIAMILYFRRKRTPSTDDEINDLHTPLLPTDEATVIVSNDEATSTEQTDGVANSTTPLVEESDIGGAP